VAGAVAYKEQMQKAQEHAFVLSSPTPVYSRPQPLSLSGPRSNYASRQTESDRAREYERGRE
jgi:hypothetical protein